MPTLPVEHDQPQTEDPEACHGRVELGDFTDEDKPLRDGHLFLHIPGPESLSPCGRWHAGSQGLWEGVGASVQGIELLFGKMESSGDGGWWLNNAVKVPGAAQVVKKAHFVLYALNVRFIKVSQKVQ